MIIAFATLCYTGILIHCGRGMIEMHFHVFIAIGALISFGSIATVLTGAATIAVHHVALYFLLPSSVFNYEASFWIVILHAAFVVLQTIPSAWIAANFAKFISLGDQLAPVVTSGKETEAKLQETASSMIASVDRQTQSLESTASHIKEFTNALSSISDSLAKNDSEAKNSTKMLNKALKL